MPTRWLAPACTSDHSKLTTNIDRISSWITLVKRKWPHNCIMTRLGTGMPGDRGDPWVPSTAPDPAGSRNPRQSESVPDAPLPVMRGFADMTIADRNAAYDTRTTSG